MNKNPSSFTSFLSNRFAQDLTYYLMDSDKAPSLDISYINDIGRSYFTSVSTSLILKEVPANRTPAYVILSLPGSMS